MEQLTILSIFIIYLLVLLFLGIWSRSESQDIKGYFIAGKKLPSWVIAFSSNATGESGWLLLGLTGMAYLVGFHAFWVVLGEVLGVAISWVFIGRRFKEYTDRYQSITVPDFLAERFKDQKNVLRFLSVFIILSMVGAYMAAQLVATGKAFNTFLDFSYTTGVLVGAAITLFYTTVGGFKAVAYTDFFQGALMALGLILLAVTGIYSAGGWSEMTATLGQIDPDLLLAMGSHGLSPEGIVSVLGFVGVGLAFLGVPQLLTRYISAKNGNEIVSGGLIAVICIIIFDVCAVLAGIAGRTLFQDLGDPETIMPVMSSELLPSVFTGLLVVVVLGAIMSTVDSLLILASSAVVRDLMQKIFRPSLSREKMASYGKITTILLGITAVPFALAEVRVIFWFVLFAWSGLAASFAPVILCALFWKKTTLAGAVSGMLGGFLMTIFWVVLFKTQFYDLYEMIPGFLAGGFFTVVVSLFTKPPENSRAEMESVKEAILNS